METERTLLRVDTPSPVDTEEIKPMLISADGQQESKVYSMTDGNTNRDAVLQIMEELRNLIQQK